MSNPRRDYERDWNLNNCFGKKLYKRRGRKQINEMILLKIIFQVIVLYQITQIISESKITRPLRTYLSGKQSLVARFLYELISCFLCTSVWVGFILTPLLFDFAKYLGYDTVTWFWNGLFFSCITWFLHVWEQSKTP